MVRSEPRSAVSFRNNVLKLICYGKRNNFWSWLCITLFFYKSDAKLSIASHRYTYFINFVLFATTSCRRDSKPRSLSTCIFK
jgi:hypothetical protein